MHHVRRLQYERGQFAAHRLIVRWCVMSVDEYRPTGRDFSELVHDKAWEHLGMTGQEFVSAWYRGDLEGDERPAVRWLDGLMRTGQWAGPAEA